MARKVKLQDTGEVSTSDKAFKAPNNKYYSSEEVYNAIVEEYKEKCNCINALKENLGYAENMRLPTIAYKFIEEYRDSFGFDALFATIIAQKGAIEWALRNRDFNSEVAKIKYIFAIIQNNVMTEYKKIKTAKIVGLHENSFAEYEDIEISNNTISSSDVSSLIGDFA